MKEFLKGLFSDNGQPSSSRVLMYLLSGLVGVILVKLFWFLTHVTEVAILSLWLGVLPTLILALVALIAAPYGINGATNVFSSLGEIFAKLKSTSTDKSDQGVK